MTKTASSGTHREALSRLLIAAIPPSTYKRVKLDIQYKIICTIVLFYCLKFIMLYSLGTEIQCLEWGIGIFGFGHFLGWFFGFVVCCSFQFFRCLASCFLASGKNKVVFRILVTDLVFRFSTSEGSQRQTCGRGSQSGFCGCVALSTALASYIF